MDTPYIKRIPPNDLILSMYASIPLRPLSSMPREMHNVSHLTKHAQALEVSPESQEQG